jgi:hypothetical protein
MTKGSDMNQTIRDAGATKRDAWFWGLLVLGLGSLANAAWMLVDPLRWYHDLPAGVPDFGDFNPHFVRDIGCAFATVGLAQIWAARSPHHRFPLVTITAVFYVAHAGLHVYDTARGAVGHHHWWLDLPGVYVPAVLVTVLSIVLARHPGDSHANPARSQAA